jgi:hypothetical protein
MNTLEREAVATAVSVGDKELNVQLSDGRKITVPLWWFPRLSEATVAQRSRFRLIGGGEGIHWPEIDEDLSVAGLLVGWHPRSLTEAAHSLEGKEAEGSHSVGGARHALARLPQEYVPLGTPTAALRGTLRLLAGAAEGRDIGWDAMLRRGNQTILFQAKSFASSKTLKQLAGLGLPTEETNWIPRLAMATAQMVDAFNPDGEGRMPKAA